jgi:diazepam-binding inhibitor (GABA receptor modulating acyl-CoA-binding protein)
LLEISSEDDTFTDLYEHCTASIEKLSLEKQLSESKLLEFYGFFKQAKDGDFSEADAPSMFDLKGKAKFSAWKANQGLTEEEAQRYYILTYASISPECEEKAIKVFVKF